MATRFTFLWDEEEKEGMTYEQLIDQLMMLGAYDIEDEDVKLEEKPRSGEAKPKKKRQPWAP
jgi:hypothetical protein